MRILPLTAILSGALALVPAVAAAAPVHRSAAVGQTTQSRFGGRGFGGGGFRSTRRYPSSSYSRYRGYPRRSFGRSLFRGVLQGLGIAYLAHLMFGLGGGGGSPFGLLLLFGLVLWFATRRRRRRSAFGY
jgi:uncharacterized membrane protein